MNPVLTIPFKSAVKPVFPVWSPNNHLILVLNPRILGFKQLPMANPEVPNPTASPVGPAVPASPDTEGATPAAEPIPPQPLSEEEQMALYEKDLKENDWGHQPC